MVNSMYINDKLEGEVSFDELLYVKPDLLDKMVVIALKKYNGFDYWFHVRDDNELPDAKEYDYLLTRIEKI